MATDNLPPRKRFSLLNPIKTCIQLSPIFFFMLVLPILSSISFFAWFFFALPLSYLNPNHGKFLTYMDTWYDENFTDYCPRSSIVVTMTVGSLTLKELKDLFTQNILQDGLPNNRSTRRYSKLEEYVTNFWGFRIWKKDPSFNIDNHIIEKDNWSGKSLDQIHEKLLNKSYPRDKSPWEMVLINNTTAGVNSVQIPRSVICLRLHHILGDEKSIIKLLTECLGHKPVPVPVIVKPKDIISSLKLAWESFLFYVSFVPNCTNCTLQNLQHSIMSHSHPWKVYNFWKDQHSQLSVRFSPMLSMKDVKQVAKSTGFSSSAVIMSIIAGAARASDVDRIGCRDAAIAWTFPMENHPPKLANHFYVAPLVLPTSITCPQQRLARCHDIFTEAQETEVTKLLNIHRITTGLLFYKWASRIAINRLIPFFIINNIADEDDHISVPFSTDTRISVGTSPGVASVLFCAIRFHHQLRIAVTAKEGVLSNQQVEKLAKDCATELENLKSLYFETPTNL